MGASLTALSAVLMAIIGRSRSGEGDYIDIAMYDSLLPWCSHYVGASLAADQPVQSAQQRSLGGAAFYNVYRCKDERYVVLGGREEKFVRQLLSALGREDLIDMCLQNAGSAQAPAIAFLSDTFLSKTRAEWEAWFDGKDICFAPVLNFVEAFAHPQIGAREMLIFGPQGEHLIGTPIKFKNEPGKVAWHAPELDAGNMGSS
jgi:crotonobetainyl-CoA:carnitine CoA-transferase CaiB-like acyl-CoA transferase